MWAEQQAEKGVQAGKRAQTNNKKVPIIVQFVYFQVQNQDWRGDQEKINADHNSFISQALAVFLELFVMSRVV